MKSKIAIFLYARLSSKRLPKKIFLKVGKKNILEIIIHRLKKIQLLKKNIPIIILTSSSGIDKKLVNFCKKKNFKYFCGSHYNIFKRTVDCIKKLDVDHFIRINFDRPFIDYFKLNKMIKYYKNSNYDIVTNNLNFCPSGLVIEIAKSKIFLDNLVKIKKKEEKEHIFNHFYANKKNFKIKNLPYKDNLKLKKIKLSLDTPKDFEKLKRIFKNFNFDYNIDTKKVLKYMLGKN